MNKQTKSNTIEKTHTYAYIRTCACPQPVSRKCDRQAVDDVDVFKLPKFAKVLPNCFLKGFWRDVLVLVEIAHEERATRLHKRPHPAHIVAVLVVSLPPEAVEKFVATCVVFGSRDAMVVDTLFPFGANAVSKV